MNFVTKKTNLHIAWLHKFLNTQTQKTQRPKTTNFQKSLSIVNSTDQTHKSFNFYTREHPTNLLASQSLSNSKNTQSSPIYNNIPQRGPSNPNPPHPNKNMSKFSLPTIIIQSTSYLLPTCGHECLSSGARLNFSKRIQLLETV